MPTEFVIDPDAVLDYEFGWNDGWLADGETITGHTVTATEGITVDSSSVINSDTDVRVWVSGATKPGPVRVTCHIVTSEGREDDRTMKFNVRDR